MVHFILLPDKIMHVKRGWLKKTASYWRNSIQNVNSSCFQLRHIPSRTELFALTAPSPDFSYDKGLQFILG